MVMMPGGAEARNLEPFAENIVSWILDNRESGWTEQVDVPKTNSLTEVYRY
jgi:hypothetical protein